MDKEYARRKFSGDYEKWPSPLSEVLEETYGVLTFQEQIMKLAIIAGFTDSESNKFRKVLVKYRDWESLLEKILKKFHIWMMFIVILSKNEQVIVYDALLRLPQAQ